MHSDISENMVFCVQEHRGVETVAIKCFGQAGDVAEDVGSAVSLAMKGRDGYEDKIEKMYVSISINSGGDSDGDCR